MATYKYGVFEDSFGVKEYKIKELNCGFFYDTWETLHTWTIQDGSYNKMMNFIYQLKVRGHICYEV